MDTVVDVTGFVVVTVFIAVAVLPVGVADVDNDSLDFGGAATADTALFVADGMAVRLDVVDFAKAVPGPDHLLRRTEPRVHDRRCSPQRRSQAYIPSQ